MPNYFDVHAMLGNTLAVKSKTKNTTNVYHELQEYIKDMDIEKIALCHRGANLLFQRNATLDDFQLDLQKSSFTDDKINQTTSTVITKQCVENGLKILYLDSDCTLIKDLIDECIKITKNRNADLGKVTINGVELAVTTQSTVEMLYDYYKENFSELSTK